MEQPDSLPCKAGKQVVKVRPYSYQPSKAELEADITGDASPEQIRDALMRPVKVEEITDS